LSQGSKPAKHVRKGAPRRRQNFHKLCLYQLRRRRGRYTAYHNWKYRKIAAWINTPSISYIGRGFLFC